MFIDDDFLLSGELAKQLYKEVKDLPIIEFHSHLDPRVIYKNEEYSSITDMWLNDDNKWRLMRSSGIDEDYITGSKADEDKFIQYAKAVEHAYLNPLQQRSQMVLKQVFGITTRLTESTAKDIFEQANLVIKEEHLTPQKVLEKLQVETICTTNDINDELEFHKLLKEEITLNVLPTFRPDSLFDINSEGFFDVITLLEKYTKTTITGITSLATALVKRLDFFNQNQCTIGDHGLDGVYYEQVTKSDASKALKKRLMHYPLTRKEVNQLRLYLLKFFIKEYAIRNMVCQLHIGAIRNTNERMYQKVGSRTGYDSISAASPVDDLNKLLSEINSHYELPKMVLYNLNPSDNEALASLCGNFSCSVPGKVQLGPAWWFNNHDKGIKDVLKVIGMYLNLSTFVGNSSDARDILSLIQHDYYRRVLCDVVAKKASRGYMPSDIEELKVLVKDLSYNNAKRYFNL